MKHQCKDGVGEQELILFHYGELPLEEGARLAAHIEGCADCRRVLQEYQTLLNAVPLSPPEVEPVDLHAFNARVVAATAPRRRVPLWAGSLAAAAAAAAFALVVMRPAPGPTVAPGIAAELGVVEELELLQTFDLLEELDLLQELEGVG